MKKSLTLIFLIPLSLVSASSSEVIVERARQLMGSSCVIQAEGENKRALNKAVNLAFDEIQRIDKLLSTHKPKSEASQINLKAHQKPQPMSKETYQMFIESKFYWAITNGAFDITRGRNWDFVHLDGKNKTIHFLKPGITIDFGAIGKGYALDKAAEVLKENGVQKALLNFGGQLLLFNNKKNPEPVVIHMAHPTIPGKTTASLQLIRGSVSTSSQWERELSGPIQWIGHIEDSQKFTITPYTGSVTVVAQTATQADALSTALIVMGEQKGLAFLQRWHEICGVFQSLENAAVSKFLISETCRDYEFFEANPNG